MEDSCFPQFIAGREKGLISKEDCRPQERDLGISSIPPTFASKLSYPVRETSPVHPCLRRADCRWPPFVGRGLALPRVANCGVFEASSPIARLLLWRGLRVRPGGAGNDQAGANPKSAQ